MLVQTNRKVEFSYPKPIFDEKLTAPIVQEMKKKAARGELTSETEAVAYFVTQVVSQPAKYTRPGDIQRDQAEVSGTGTGFIIDSSGTTITAGHVVSNEGSEIKQTMAVTALKKVTVEWCQALIQDLVNDDRIRKATNSEDLTKRCINGFKDYYAQHLELDDVETQTAIVLQSAQPGQNAQPKVIPSEIKKIGTEMPQEDVAILTVKGENNLPTIALGDDKSVAAGQQVRSIGFPGAINDSDSKTLPEPTLTTGAVSARQGSLIQTEAAVSPGSSGGPLFNEQGEVIGIASFLKQNEAGAPVGGAYFFVPITIAKQFLQAEGITPKDSDVSHDYQRAIELFQSKQFHKALALFKDIRDRNPNFPYIQQKISQTMNELPNEPFFIPDWAYGAGALLVICGAGGYGMKRYRSRKSASESAPSWSLTTFLQPFRPGQKVAEAPVAETVINNHSDKVEAKHD